MELNSLHVIAHISKADGVENNNSSNFMEQIRNYFNAEKAESLLFIAVGLIAISVGIYFLTVVKHSYNTGMCIPLITVALIQLFVGTTIYFRSSKDITHIENIVSVDKSRILSEEIPRMKTVMKNFIIYRTVEIILMIIGLILFFFLDPMIL